MSKFGEQIAANRAARERHSVEVSEWGTEDSPLVIYYGAVTGSDIDKVQRKHKDFLTNPTMPAMVEVLLIKSEDEHGEKIFTLEDKPTLMREPFEIITRVFGTVFNATSLEEQEKN
jgi:hypothetical protein